MKGFNVMQYMMRWLFGLIGLYYYYMTGKIDLPEHIEDGVEKFPEALSKMFSGGHIGKMMVKVSEE